jgi:Uma2 family endonuclease
MANTAQPLMTVEAFFLWCEHQEERYELVDGVPVPLRSMAGASLTHDAIAINLIVALGNQLRGTGCRPTTPEAALRTAIRRVRRPDVTIECSPPVAKTYETRNPVAVFEILSPSTKLTDQLIKLPEYMRHQGLKIIVLINPDVMEVVVYSRAADGQWDSAAFEQPLDEIVIAQTPAKLTLAEIYDGVPLEAHA